MKRPTLAHILFFVALLFATFTFFLAPEDLFARAGGGGGYGGGGGGGGGSGGGGSGGGELIIFLIRLTIRYPLVMIPIWCVAGFVYFQAQKAGQDHHFTRTVRRGRKVQEQALRDQAIAEIEEHDPAFSSEIFLARAENAFLATQYAWSDHQLSRCRAFISDGIHERFSLYLDMLKAQSLRDRMQDVNVRDKEIVAVTTDSHFETLHVRFSASAVNYYENLETGKYVRGDRSQMTFAEIWSFSRRPGVETNPNASLLQGKCPNCGGPVEIVDRASCPQCDSVVNSGQYDWVLAEITQDEEWVVPPTHHAIPQWNQLADADPGLNYQHLEDRASVIFWRCMMSLFFEDFTYAKPVLTAERSELPDRWQLEPGQFWKMPAVGVVEVIQCEPATSDGFDRIHVLVRWSGTRAEGDRSRPKEHGIQRIYSHVMILKRKTGVISHADQTFSSANCSSCGAPIDSKSSNTCGYCNAVLNDGSADWILEDVRTYSSTKLPFSEEGIHIGASTETRLEHDRLHNTPELLEAVTKIVISDGELHDAERNQLKQLATRRGVSEEQLQQIFDTAVSDDQPIDLPTDPAAKKDFMDQLMRAALADGALSSKEKSLLKSVSDQLGWSTADLKMSMSRARRTLYRESKAAIKSAKRSV